jgi:hypothetical protein
MIEPGSITHHMFTQYCRVDEAAIGGTKGQNTTTKEGRDTSCYSACRVGSRICLPIWSVAVLSGGYRKVDCPISEGCHSRGAKGNMVIVRVNRRATCTHYGKGGFSFTVARPIFGNDCLGNPTNGKGPIEAAERRHPSLKALGILPRRSVNQPCRPLTHGVLRGGLPIRLLVISRRPVTWCRQHGKPPGWW